MNACEYSRTMRSLIEENTRLRNKLLELAKECAGCGGTGVVATPEVLRRVLVYSTTPCADCADIRRVLA